MDDEAEARACFTPEDQFDWNKFTWTDPIALGSISGRPHSIRFDTIGQQYSVADLDKFTIADYPPEEKDCDGLGTGDDQVSD